MTEKEIKRSEEDLAWWTSVFDHMVGTRVHGWTYRDSVSVVDHNDVYNQYTYSEVLPILVLKGMVDTTKLCKGCNNPTYGCKYDICHVCATKERDKMIKEFYLSRDNTRTFK